MKETADHIRIAGEFIRMANSGDDPEEEVFEAIFKEDNDNSDANIQSKKDSQEVAFSLEIRIT